MNKLNQKQTRQIVSVLEKAHALIKNPNNWTKGVLAENKYKQHCEPTLPDAIRFCLLGAIQKVIFTNKMSNKNQGILYQSTFYSFSDCKRTVVDINDNLGHGAVLKFLKRKINSLKKSLGENV